MSRPLTPFIRHMGEARYRCRLIRAAVERIEGAAVAAATPAACGAALAQAIDAARYQLALLEQQAVRWRIESDEAPRPSPGDALRGEIAEFLSR